MQIAGIQKTTLVDYPGKIAATIFLRGCNFRCGFCHNPEIVLPEHFTQIIPEEELFRFLESRLGKLDGVCITGGEPLLWGDTASLISHIKALGFAVKLDTNGSYPERLEQIIRDGDLDYIAMDIKATPEKYKSVANFQLPILNNQIKSNNQFTNKNQKKHVIPAPKEDRGKHPTGIQNHNSNGLIFDIQKSIELIMKSGIDYEFRTTVAKPIHHPNDFLEIGKLVKGAKRFYIQNFVKSKQIDSQSTFAPFDRSELMRAASIMKTYLSDCIIR